jgi:transposase
MPWSRRKAYSQDLRKRVFALADDGCSVGFVAEQLLVSTSYVSKALSRRRLTGEMTTRPQRCQVAPRLIDMHAVIAAEVAARPDATLDELRQWLLAAHTKTASKGLMHKTLALLGLTHKKSPSTLLNKSGPMLPRREMPGARTNPS